ncbi:helix-turn-helix domain-containing protein [Nocardioides alcanivorans]|uniref:helix-turn-helix domain-containing protein n=1 Tax=Nocardioides alcanivorans TaxID=2897352 RepID=UPI001F24EAB4|nr:helix-turn-helix domain-containing protein [Nocardioides alcanivorans]
MSSSPSRPRIEGDRQREILAAALDVLVEVGYDRLTMDAVARAARASKATLYRRWTNKPTLVIDALLAVKDVPRCPTPDRCARTSASSPLTR